MALRDVLKKQEKAKPKTWLEVLSEELDKEDYEWLIECLKNRKDFSGVYIANKLTEAGYPVSSTTVNQTRQRF